MVTGAWGQGPPVAAWIGEGAAKADLTTEDKMKRLAHEQARAVRDSNVKREELRILKAEIKERVEKNKVLGEKQKGKGLKEREKQAKQLEHDLKILEEKMGKGAYKIKEMEALQSKEITCKELGISLGDLVEIWIDIPAECYGRAYGKEGKNAERIRKDCNVHLELCQEPDYNRRKGRKGASIKGSKANVEKAKEQLEWMMHEVVRKLELPMQQFMALKFYWDKIEAVEKTGVRPFWQGKNPDSRTASLRAISEDALDKAEEAIKRHIDHSISCPLPDKEAFTIAKSQTPNGKNFLYDLSNQLRVFLTVDKDAEQSLMVEEKFGEHNFRVLSEMRGFFLYIDPIFFKK